jgi:predicted metal-dependent hydrolase
VTEDGAARPPAALGRFLDLYAEGRFWDSHEALETAWRRTGSDFYQGLILYASAWVHWERGNAHGVRAQLRKALERLGGYPSWYLGMDLSAVRSHCEEVRLEVTRDPDGWPGSVAAGPLTFVPSRVRGDEVELLDVEPEASEA